MPCLRPVQQGGSEKRDAILGEVGKPKRLLVRHFRRRHVVGADHVVDACDNHKSNVCSSIAEHEFTDPLAITNPGLQRSYARNRSARDATMTFWTEGSNDSNSSLPL